MEAGGDSLIISHFSLTTTKRTKNRVKNDKSNITINFI